MTAKRTLDLVGSGIGLILLSPVLIGIAAAVRLDSPGPVFFRQERVGLGGARFRIHKFRTMTVDVSGTARQITVGADRRITRSGHFLRKYKLDELAQLIDVFFGQMSLVGPRPEVPRYVDTYPDDVRGIVLSVKPGITDLASIEYQDESTLLGQSDDPEKTYVEEILPVKLRYCVEYVEHRSLLLDIRIILRTIKAVLV